MGLGTVESILKDIITKSILTLQILNKNLKTNYAFAVSDLTILTLKNDKAVEINDILLK